MQHSESSLIPESGISSIIQKHAGELIIIFLYWIVKWSFLSHIIILFCIGVGPVFEEKFHQTRILIHDGDMEWSTSINVSAIYICLLIYISQYKLSSKFMASTELEWPTAWNKRLLPGNSGNNILFIC